jgi:hypothetical protein
MPPGVDLRPRMTTATRVAVAAVVIFVLAPLVVFAAGGLPRGTTWDLAALALLVGAIAAIVYARRFWLLLALPVGLFTNLVAIDSNPSCARITSHGGDGGEVPADCVK